MWRNCWNVVIRQLRVNSYDSKLNAKDKLLIYGGQLAKS